MAKRSYQFGKHASTFLLRIQNLDISIGNITFIQHKACQIRIFKHAHIQSWTEVVVTPTPLPPNSVLPRERGVTTFLSKILHPLY